MRQIVTASPVPLRSYAGARRGRGYREPDPRGCCRFASGPPCPQIAPASRLKTRNPHWIERFGSIPLFPSTPTSARYRIGCTRESVGRTAQSPTRDLHDQRRSRCQPARQRLDGPRCTATRCSFRHEQPAASAEAPMTTSQPWRFLEPYWNVRDVLGWLIDRDPKRFARIFNLSDLRAATLYRKPGRKDNNPTRTLLHAFQEGRLQAFRDGQSVPVEFWSTRSAANVRDDVDTRVRRNDVLALWPESWKWAQAVVWAVCRDEEMVALCDQDRLRYAQRGAERLRAGLRPAGSEQDLRTLLRAAQITARAKREGDNSVDAIQPESGRSGPACRQVGARTTSSLMRAKCGGSFHMSPRPSVLRNPSRIPIG